MTMFASRTPESLNTDPYPIVVLDHDGKIMARFPTMKAANYYRSEYVPIRSARTSLNRRPEFDHPQHNPPNPILVEVRKNGATPEEIDLWLAAIAGQDPDSYDEGDFAFCDSQSVEAQDHAARVLTRLANLTKEDYT